MQIYYKSWLPVYFYEEFSYFVVLKISNLVDEIETHPYFRKLRKGGFVLIHFFASCENAVLV
jgi:hypothetical protein